MGSATGTVAAAGSATGARRSAGWAPLAVDEIDAGDTATPSVDFYDAGDGATPPVDVVDPETVGVVIEGVATGSIPGGAVEIEVTLTMAAPRSRSQFGVDAAPRGAGVELSTAGPRSNVAALTPRGRAQVDAEEPRDRSALVASAPRRRAAVSVGAPRSDWDVEPPRRDR